jgi:broad specificity phosphatase PhoE
MKVVFVRHGESEANVADFINDDPRRPVNLTEQGRAQAATAGQRLRNITFRHAFASEFPRARQTAKIILQHHDRKPVIDARLNERKSGMDGLPTCTFNDMVRPDPIHIRPPFGENFLEQTERVRAFLSMLETLGDEDNVLAVSHEYRQVDREWRSAGESDCPYAAHGTATAPTI